MQINRHTDGQTDRSQNLSPTSKVFAEQTYLTIAICEPYFVRSHKNVKNIYLISNEFKLGAQLNLLTENFDCTWDHKYYMLHVTYFYAFIWIKQTF